MPTNYFIKARTCLELCRFSYKMYAQTVKFPFDPFFEADAKNTNNVGQITRKRMMTHIHDLLLTPANNDRRKFDPIQYRLDAPPDPSHSVVYRGDTDNSYIIFVPDVWDYRIGAYAGFDLNAKKLPEPPALGGNCRCGYFQGQTGMTANHPNSTWTSFLGAVIYDPTTRTAYIVFRGSRSGDGFRAATRAQFWSEGSPDWVTDMNHLKEAEPFNPNFDFGDSAGRADVRLSTGFWVSYASSSKSMEAAFKYAVNGNQVDSICVTGHSLGGGLAQCAYIHLTTSPRIKTRLGLPANVLIECYPISAPPICLGVASQHWVSRNTNASNVHHYYCPNDAVHACDLVLGSGATKSAKVLSWRHPRTSSYHFGSQVALNSTAEFPLAHEPFIIWRALWDDSPAPKNFWQTAELDLLASRIKSTSTEDSITDARILQAIKDSYVKADFKERADQWAAGISWKVIGDTKQPAVDCINMVNEHDFTSSTARDAMANNLVVAKLNKSRRENRSDTAGCVYHTLLVWIGIQRLLGKIVTTGK